MEKVSIYKFYEFGRLISKTEFIEPQITNFEFYNHITHIIDTINEIDLPFSKKIVINKLTTTHSYFFKISGSKPREIVNENKLEKTKKIIKEIEQILKLELPEKFAYVPSSLKIDINNLTNRMDNLFDEGTLTKENIPFPIIFNVFQFGQCYAFGVFTAASIHILKATEEYNRFLNQHLKESKNIKENDCKKSWNDTINETKELISNNSRNKELIQFLHTIKNNYRNEIMHLNRMFLEDEAYDLFNMCTKVINQMNRILKTLPNNV